MTPTYSPGPPAARPPTVKRIWILAIIQAALGTINVVFTLVAGGEGVGGVASRFGSLTSGLIGIALYLFLAHMVGQRKEWARIVLGVLAILGVIGNVGATLSAIAALTPLAQFAGWQAVLVISIVLTLVGAVLLTLMAVSAFNRQTADWCRPTPVDPRYVPGTQGYGPTLSDPAAMTPGAYPAISYPPAPDVRTTPPPVSPPADTPSYGTPPSAPQQ